MVSSNENYNELGAVQSYVEISVIQVVKDECKPSSSTCSEVSLMNLL
jgi:hypothetical protein